jgi:hypothetical protein
MSDVSPSSGKSMMLRPVLFSLALVAVLGGAHCNGDSHSPTAPESPAVAKVDVSPTTVAADGSTLVLVHATPSAAVSGPSELVVLTSSTGSFPAVSANTITGIASTVSGLDAMLRVGRDTGAFVIKAYSGSSTAVTTLHLTPAFAQQLVLSATALSVAPKATIAVTATAIRSPGLVSRFTPILFTLTRADGGPGFPAGAIDSPTVTDSLGLATVHFTAGNSGTADSVWLTAQVASGDSSKPIQNQIKLYITP